MASARLVLFDPYVGGHHADHLAWLARAWHDREVRGDLVIAASPALLERHAEVTALAGASARGGVRVRPLPYATRGQAPSSLGAVAVQHVRLVGHLVREEAPERLFAMYLDHAQIAFALRRRRGGPRLSGLLFRPETHLSEEGSLRSKARHVRKRFLLHALASAPATEAIFTLDPRAASALRAELRGAEVHAVPDPAPTDDPCGADIDVRGRYEVEAGRALWVLPGALGARKGVDALAEAIQSLSPSLGSKVCLLLAGKAAEGEGDRVEAAVEAIATRTCVQVIWDRRFLSRGELQATIAQADVVLAPYVGHVGSSGIVMRAAAAARPLVAQQDGLVGWQTRTHALGRTVDPLHTESFAAALADLVETPTRGFDPERARAFASSHTVDAYTEAIFGPLGLLDEASRRLRPRGPAFP